MVRTSWVAAVVLLSAACGERVAPRTPFPFSELPASDASQFTPAVPEPPGEGQCGSAPSWGVEGRTLALAFGEPVTRHVRVTFNESGDPVRYYDFRGDTDVREPHDDRTLLQIEFDRGIVSVLDRKDGASLISRFELSAALDAESLGNPRRMIELIRFRCG